MRSKMWLLIVLTTFCLTTIAVAQAPEKKLIEYGWDVPNPLYVADNIAQMEQRPFDGLIFRMTDISQIFVNQKWDEAKYQEEFDACARIKWGSFTDNFLVMYAASSMDWFNDSDWEAVIHNVRLNVKAARMAKCVGVCFDHEPYGFNPWHYPSQVHGADKSFAEYSEVARRRGQQFMQCIQEEMPRAVIHTFFQLSYFQDIARQADLAVREKRLANDGYGLLPAFLNGMLDVMGPEITITDGNESSYYYTSALPFYQAFHNIRQTALSLVDPVNRVKYLSQMQCAQALYVDYVFKYWPYYTPAEEMTEEERAIWWEHNVYYAMTTSDKYVWLYSEKMDWWADRDLPPGMAQATASAREKVNTRKPFGYEMSEIMQRIEERQAARLKARLFDRTAEIKHITVAERPVIDGKFGDACWTKISALEAFVPWATSSLETPKAETLAWVAWDEQNLYMVIRCAEPNLNALKISGNVRDSDIWNGDSLDIFLASGIERSPFHHLIINPDNIRWDAVQNSETDPDTTWDPNYSSATYKEGASGFWSVEIELPWSELGVKNPAAGMQLAANICRNRQSDDSEYTSWNPCLKGFQEPNRFGIWTLK